MYNHSLIEEKQEETLRKSRNQIYQVSGIPQNTLKLFRNNKLTKTAEKGSNYPQGSLLISRIKENSF